MFIVEEQEMWIVFCLVCKNLFCFVEKNLVMWKSILFRKKNFWSSSSKKHFVSQAKNIYGTGAVDRKKCRGKN